MKKTNLIIFIAIIAPVILGAFFINLREASAAAVCSKTNLRWANSSNRIYITGNVECTLSEVKSFISKSAPLELVDPTNKVWFLGANLVLQQGATLLLYGDAVGGDVNELRLKSNNATSTFNYIWIRADWGTIKMDSTKVFSWNESSGAVDTEYTAYKRAYIRVRSSLDGDGVTPRESRMDIKNSEVGFLGFAGSEAYGLSWKVKGKQAGLYDKVGVYGDIVNSRIHDNYFGIYTYGAEKMKFLNNEIYNNVVYGLDPHDDSDYLTIDGNYVHNNGKHGIICSKRCNDLTITNNISSNNGGNGIMLHRDADYSIVKGNELYNNADSGIAIFDSRYNQISDNISKYNKKGIRLSVGSSDNTILGNVFSENTTYGVFFYKGSDPPSFGDGRIKNNTFEGNTINNNNSYAVKVKEADSNTFQNNTIEGNYKGIYLYKGEPRSNVFSSNIIRNNGSYNLKLNGAHQTVVQNNIFEGSKYGILASSTNNALISNNTTTDNYKTGIQLKGGRDNIISGNAVLSNQRGIDLVYSSEGNVVSGNKIENNTGYAVYVYQSSGNTFENNTLSNNRLNYYYLKYDSQNTVKDSGNFSVKAGDSLSSMLVVDGQGYVFQNSKNLKNKVSSTSVSVLTNQSTSGKSIVSFERLSLKINPDSGELLVLPLVWETSNNLYKKWTEEKSIPPAAASHSVGNLLPNTSYNVLVNGGLWGSFVSNSLGIIEFNYTAGYNTGKTFEVEQTF
jgi:parallel beta-helix repeat protein